MRCSDKRQWPIIQLETIQCRKKEQIEEEEVEKKMRDDDPKKETRTWI